MMNVAPDTDNSAMWDVPIAGKGKGLHDSRVHTQVSAKGRLHTVIYKAGAFVRATPSSDARHIGVLEYGDEVMLTDKERPSRDETGIVYCKLVNSGWVRKSFNGENVFQHIIAPPAAPEAAASTANYEINGGASHGHNSPASPASPITSVDSKIDGEPAKAYIIEHQDRQMTLLLGSTCLVIAHASQVPVTPESVCTRVQISDVIGADVNATAEGDAAKLFRLRIWRQEEGGGRSEGAVVFKALEPPTPGPFLRALTAQQTQP